MKVYLMAAAMSMTANASVTAAWDTNSAMLCRAEAAAWCSPHEGSCRKQDTNAIWSVNFKDGIVAYFGSDIRERIVARHRMIHESETIGESAFLESGRIMRFFDAETDVSGWFVPMVLVGASLSDSVEAATFPCVQSF